jgi:hypothetical protein
MRDAQPRMTTHGVPEDALSALAAGPPRRIGRWMYNVRADSWQWSDTFFAVLGFEPGQVRPSAAVLAAHLRPDDADRGFDAVERAFRTGEPFSFYSRMVDAHGTRRTVLLAGHGEPDGAVHRVHGYLVDLTDAAREASRTDVEEALAGALDHRAVIEQAKGVLMLAHGVEADEAFGLLRAYSQDNNVKVRDVCDRLVQLVTKDGRADEGFLRQVLQIFDEIDDQSADAALGT